MKKSILFLCMFGFYTSQAQNNPVIEKSAPKSNNTLPSAGALGSNSGVNPNGNPGTISSFSGNSNSINTAVPANPNIEPGTFLNSSPEGTEIRSTVTSGSTTVQNSTTVVANGGTVTATVAEPAATTVLPTPVAAEINVTAPAKIKTPAKAIPETRAVATLEKKKNIPAYTPTKRNFISETVLAKLKEKYGADIYDIRTVRIAATRKIAYLVRVLDDGKLRDEIYYDQP